MYINHCGSFADRTEGSQLCDKKYILIPIVIFDIWQFLNKLCNSLNNWHEHFRVRLNWKKIKSENFFAHDLRFKNAISNKNVHIYYKWFC